MKKLLVMALFGLAGLAAFAGTCAVTHISLVSTDASHDTFAGQLDNTSGVNILQHDFVVAFLDSSNNLVETKSVAGCLRSVQNNTTDFFSATSTSSASVTSTGLARIAFDSTFKVGTTSSQNVSISNVTANRTINTSPATLTVAGKLTNNSGTIFYSPNICIVVRTSAGNVLITANTSTSDLSASSGTSNFTDTVTVPNDSTATTVDIWVDGLDGSSNPTTPQSAGSFSITTGGTATHMSFSVQPVGGVGIGPAVFGTSPSVSILDTNGAVVTSGADSTKIVTLTVLASSVPVTPVTTLTCTSGTAVAAINGIATFTGCQVNHADANIQLTASASSLTAINSSSFAINPGVATALSFTALPATSPAGAVSQLAFTTQPVVTVVDANGDVVWTGTNSTAVVTIAAITGPSALAGCTTNPVTAVAGVANFGACSLALVGTYSLTANGGAPALTQGTSASFAVSAGVATKLAFTTQPGAASGHATNTTPLTPQPVVAVEDAAGNIVTTSTAAITLTLSTGGGALACTTPASFPANATAGVLTPTVCWISAAGAADVITASSAGLTSAVSTAFAVS